MEGSTNKMNVVKAEMERICSLLLILDEYKLQYIDRPHVRMGYLDASIKALYEELRPTIEEKDKDLLWFMDNHLRALTKRKHNLLLGRKKSGYIATFEHIERQLRLFIHKHINQDNKGGKIK
jgi:hypothetical protein